MAPRARKIRVEKGMINFYIGVSDLQIEEFLARNNINKSDTKQVGNPLYVSLEIPPSEEYIVPDDVYIWFHSVL